MKSLVLVFVLMLVVSSGVALECLHCVPAKAGGACTITTATCPSEKDACVAAKFKRPPYGRFQKCFSMSDCELTQKNAYISIKCCQEDSCNTFE